MCVCGDREGWEGGSGNLGESGCVDLEGGIALSGVLLRRLQMLAEREEILGCRGCRGCREVGDWEEGGVILSIISD